MRKFYAALAVVLVGAYVVFLFGLYVVSPKEHSGLSAARVAGLSVDDQARRAGVTILGDKVYSERKLPSGEVLVAVRVRYHVPPIDTPYGLISGYTNVVTIYVREAKSSYTVIG